MAKSTVSVEEQIAAHFRALADLYAGKKSSAKPSIHDAVEEPEEDENDEEGELELLNREETESLGIKELRALAAEYLEDAPTKKADILAALEEFYDEEEEDEDDEEEDEDDEDEEEDEEGEYDRDDLMELDVKELRKIAKEEGHTAADYKGMDQDALVDLILGEGDDEDEDDEEDEAEDDDVEELDEDALAAMSHKELIALAKELEIKVPKPIQKSTKANQKKLVDLILDSGDDDE